MSPTTLPSVRRQGASVLTGRHVLIAVLLFFGVIFAVNGVLLWQAIATHSGLVANEPYRKGLEYNQRIDADERQQTLGWSEVVTIHARDGVAVTLTDQAGQPVSRMVLTGTIGRPSTVRHDVALRFEEPTPGRYVATVSGLEPGAWLINLEAKPASGTADAHVYRMKRRLWLKQ